MADIRTFFICDKSKISKERIFDVSLTERIFDDVSIILSQIQKIKGEMTAQFLIQCPHQFKCRLFIGRASTWIDCFYQFKCSLFLWTEICILVKILGWTSQWDIFGDLIRWWLLKGPQTSILKSNIDFYFDKNPI